METYRKYFDIDPDFFPAVNKDVIAKEPNLWKKYFPHETFVSLIKQTVSVLERKQKLNIWVEGAYGTGKSHAVLTLKHLLDASEADVDEYFKQFGLDDDLRKRFLATKHDGRILTIHRYGSSSIHGDQDLFLAMQESIEAELKAQGIENHGSVGLKDAIIAYLSDEENKQSIEVYVKGSYSDLFGGKSVDEIVQNLKEYTGEALQSLMSNIYKLANDKNIKAFILDKDSMLKWISEIIKLNNLKALVFIWDEFTDYFRINKDNLSGIQEILEFSETNPFCFIPVSHMNMKDAGIEDTQKDKSRIQGRFIRPACSIELPDNMAFQLMGAAMQLTDDQVVVEEWNEIKNDLELRTNGARKRIIEHAKIKDKELRAILPIHPYAASLLKHISASFASNQRSMFDFIKNGGNEDNCGFQWYIDNFGPLEDDNPFLTIDLLWGFFYDNGKNDLDLPIRQILDRYSSLSKHLDADEQKVLKTILLFQAISQSNGDSVDIFLPNEKNLGYAFEGTDLDNGQAIKCAEKLCRDEVIYKRPRKDGSFLYSILTGGIDAGQLNKIKEEFRKKTTANLIQNGQLNEAIIFPQQLKLRFQMAYAGVSDIDQIVKKFINEEQDHPQNFYAIICLSKTTSESIAMAKKIHQARIDYKDSEIVFIDCGKVPLGEDEFERWVEYTATASFLSGKDNAQSAQNNNYASQILTKWGSRIAQGPFVLYSKGAPSGVQTPSVDSLIEALLELDKKRFPLALECNFKSINPWWMSNSLQIGVECGVKRELKGTYSSKNASLKDALAFAWTTEEYWKTSPAEPISRIKSKLEEFIQEKLKNEGRVSIKAIYDFLASGSFGFMPCNMTAFFMGFLLKEYVGETYSWSDEISSDSLTLQKMREMVEGIIKLQNTPNSRYRDNYIVTTTPEEKAFINGTSDVFGLSKSVCSSVEAVRDRIRGKMKDNLFFPIWTLSEILDTLQTSTSKDVIKELISLYQDLVNNTTTKSETEIANNIGKLFISNNKAANDLHNILTEQNCKNGMLHYLSHYREGILPELANKIDDGGQYINALKRKFDAGEANWVWKPQTVDQQIDIVILEYQIAAETCEILSNVSTSYKEAISAWLEKIANIKVSLETVKKHVSNIQPFLSALRDLKAQGAIAEGKKESFLELLKNYGKEFITFYHNQIDAFKSACGFYLDGLSDADVDKIFLQLKSGSFGDDNATFCKKVEDLVTAYKNELSSSKLKSLWQEKTGTLSPFKWSEQYHMPILVMIKPEEEAECRTIFSIINRPNPGEKEVNKALKFLEDFHYWDDLMDAKKREDAFRRKILKDRSVMIDNLEELQTYISSRVSEAPFHWMGNSQVDKVIDNFAQMKYNSSGYQTAIEVIDVMNPDDVKKYLKDLIKNNMNVGIQIISNR